MEKTYSDEKEAMVLLSRVKFYKEMIEITEKKLEDLVFYKIEWDYTMEELKEEIEEEWYEYRKEDDLDDGSIKIIFNDEKYIAHYEVIVHREYSDYWDDHRRYGGIKITKLEKI